MSTALHSLGSQRLSILQVCCFASLFVRFAPRSLLHSTQYVSCSKWGHNRVVDQHVTGKPVELVLPVLTRPDIVEQAVAGILSGQVSLSLSNVEALLVFANAVGVSHMVFCASWYLHAMVPRSTCRLGY